MARAAPDNVSIGGGFQGAACIARISLDYVRHMIQIQFNTLETTAGEYGQRLVISGRVTQTRGDGQK